MSTESIRIVYMGTPEFAVAPLEALLNSGMTVCGVVTAPDKPAGRGKKLKGSPVKEFASTTLDCPVLQPENLKDPGFIEELKSLGGNLFIVVAFRMLPVQVWSMPEYGTINLHASLLPQYRGAAPINWCLINGEKKTGVTTFLIDQQIDTGRILMREELDIAPTDDAGSLHDRLMQRGAKLVLRTIRQLAAGDLVPIDQEAYSIPEDRLKKAPKIFREDCRISWKRKGTEIVNLTRGLSPYPGAFTILVRENSVETLVKIYRAEFERADHDLPVGTVISDNSEYLKVCVPDGQVNIISLQAEGKKRMTVGEYLHGVHHDMNSVVFR